MDRFLRAIAGTSAGERIQFDVPMSALTSLRVGGPADLFLDAAGSAEAAMAVAAATAAGLPYHVIGLGTNLLVRDGGIRGLVVRIGPGMAAVDWDEATLTVTAGGGARLRLLAQEAAARGWRGLEFAEGIPGTIGGAVMMNAGAYDGETGDLVEAVDVLDLVRIDTEDEPHQTEQVLRLGREDLSFGYRTSSLQCRPLAVVAVRLALPGRDDPVAIRGRMEDLGQRRRARQPLEWPSAGSYFKRPPGQFAGQLIEECGLKGYRIGGAEVSPKHAGFIVNVGGASAADVLAVASHVQEAVLTRRGIELIPEVRVVGEDAASRS